MEFGQADITKSGFESTHDWWSFTETPLSVCEGVIDAQDALVEKLKYVFLSRASFARMRQIWLSSSDQGGDIK